MADTFLENDKLRQEYTQDKNSISPDRLTTSSRKKVWWRCENAHEWEATVESRVMKKRGCPYCANQRVLPGQNDFATTHPEKAALWHPERNGKKRPEQYVFGSDSTIWWQCEKGHSWQAKIYAVSRAAENGCPYCRGLRSIPGETDLATTHPDLVPLWDQEKNASLTPQTVTAGSKRKAWWRCEKGHGWQAQVHSLTNGGTRCPYCAGTLALTGETDITAVAPEIAKEWDYEKNGPRDPKTVTAASHEKIWWRCELGHSWQAAPFSRTKPNGSGCPYCSGRKVLPGFNDLKTLKPELAKQWHPTMNGTLRPTDVTLGSNKKAWWQCSDKHIWQAYIYARTRKNASGCPVCAGTVKYIPPPKQTPKKA